MLIDTEKKHISTNQVTDIDSEKTKAKLLVSGDQKKIDIVKICNLFMVGCVDGAPNMEHLGQTTIPKEFDILANENPESNISKIARGISNSNAKILTTCVVS